MKKNRILFLSIFVTFLMLVCFSTTVHAETILELPTELEGLYIDIYEDTYTLNFGEEQPYNDKLVIRNQGTLKPIIFVHDGANALIESNLEGIATGFNSPSESANIEIADGFTVDFVSADCETGATLNISSYEDSQFTEILAVGETVVLNSTSKITKIRAVDEATITLNANNNTWDITYVDIIDSTINFNDSQYTIETFISENSILNLDNAVLYRTIVAEVVRDASQSTDATINSFSKITLNNESSMNVSTTKLLPNLIVNSDSYIRLNTTANVTNIELSENSEAFITSTKNISNITVDAAKLSTRIDGSINNLTSKNNALVEIDGNAKTHTMTNLNINNATVDFYNAKYVINDHNFTNANITWRANAEHIGVFQLRNSDSLNTLTIYNTTEILNNGTINNVVYKNNINTLINNNILNNISISPDATCNLITSDNNLETIELSNGKLNIENNVPQLNINRIKGNNGELGLKNNKVKLENVDNANYLILKLDNVNLLANNINSNKIKKIDSIKSAVIFSPTNLKRIYANTSDGETDLIKVELNTVNFNYTGTNIQASIGDNTNYFNVVPNELGQIFIPVDKTINKLYVKVEGIEYEIDISGKKIGTGNSAFIRTYLLKDIIIGNISFTQPTRHESSTIDILFEDVQYLPRDLTVYVQKNDSSYRFANLNFVHVSENDYKVSFTYTTNETDTPETYKLYYNLDGYVLTNEVIATIIVPEAQPSETEILDFVVPNARVYFENNTIKIYVPFDSNLLLTPIITVSENCTVSPASGVQQDFTNTITYTVHNAYNSIDKTYTVMAIKDTAPSIRQVRYTTNELSVSGYNLPEQFQFKIFDASNNLKESGILVLNEVTGKYLSSYSLPANNTTADINYTIKFYVNGTELSNYDSDIITVYYARSDNANIRNITIPGVSIDTQINSTTITILIPYTITETNFTANIELDSDRATYNTNQLRLGNNVIIVTAENGSTKNYTVKVQQEAQPIIEGLIYNHNMPSSGGSLSVKVSGQNISYINEMRIELVSTDRTLTQTLNNADTTTFTIPSNNSTTPITYNLYLYVEGVRYDFTEQYTLIVDRKRNSNTNIDVYIPNQVGSTRINGNYITITMPYNTDLTSLIPDITVSSDSTVYPPTGVAQDFSAPVTYTVTADDGSIRSYVVTVELETTPNITSITFEDNFADGKMHDVDFVIRGSNFDNSHEITLFAKNGTDFVKSICTVNSNSKASCTLTFPKNTTRQDKIYSLVVDLDGIIYDIGTRLTYPYALSEEKDILSFSIPGALSTEINEDTINILMPYGTNVSALTPYIQVSNLASIIPNSNSTQDFSSRVTYTVTAEDGSEKEYTVRVSIQEILDVEKLQATLIRNGQYEIEIIGNNLDFIQEPTIVVKNNLGEDLFSQTCSANKATITLPQNTTNYDVDYFLFLYDGNHIIQTPELKLTQPGVFSSDNDIIDFIVPNSLKVEIEESTRTIKVYVDPSFNLQAVYPQITVSTGALITPANGQRVNITEPIIYTVRAEDTTIKEYTVMAVIEPEFSITDLTYINPGSSHGGPREFTLVGTRLYEKTVEIIAEYNGTTISGTFVDGKCTLDFPYNWDYFTKTYTLTLKVDGVIYPLSSEKTYTIKQHLHQERRILDFYVYGIKNISIGNNTIDVEVYRNIDITNLKPIITVSDYATYTPNTYRDFTNPVTYTVTAEDTYYTHEYTVTFTKSEDDIPIPTVSNVSGLTNISVLGELKTIIVEGENLDKADVLDVILTSGTEKYTAQVVEIGGLYRAIFNIPANISKNEKIFNIAVNLNGEIIELSDTVTQNGMNTTIISEVQHVDMKNYNINQDTKIIDIIMNYNVSASYINFDYIVPVGVTITQNPFDYSEAQEVIITNLDGETVTYTVNVTVLASPDNVTAEITKEHPYGGLITVIVNGNNLDNAENITFEYVKEGEYLVNTLPVQKVDGKYTVSFTLPDSLFQDTTYEYEIIVDGNVKYDDVFILEELIEDPIVFSVTGNILPSIGGTTTVIATGEYLHANTNAYMALVSRTTGQTYYTDTLVATHSEMIGTFNLPENITFENEIYDLVFILNHEEVDYIELPTVTVRGKLNNEANILTFHIEDAVSVNIGENTIEVLMPYYATLNYLRPDITISYGATVLPGDGEPQDFTNPILYTVMAADGTNKEYTVTVRKQDPPVIEITNILHDNPATYEETDILFNVFGTNLNLAQVKLVAYGNNTEFSGVVTYKDGAHLATLTFPENRTPNPVSYTVKSYINNVETGIERTVIVPGHLIDPLISEFKVNEQIGSSIINHELNSIKVIVPYTVSLADVIPEITINNILTITPSIGTKVNLNEPVTYTVTNGQITKTYTVYVERENTFEITNYNYSKIKSNDPGEIDIEIVGENLSEVVDLLILKLVRDGEVITAKEIYTKNSKIYAKVDIPKNSSTKNEKEYTITTYLINDKFDYTETLTVPEKESSSGGGGGGGGGGSSSGGSIGGGSTSGSGSSIGTIKPPVLIPTTPVDPTPVTSYLRNNVAYISGYEDSSFRPQNAVTRAEVAVMLSRLLSNFDNNKTYENYFLDVPTNAWYSNAVNFMKEQGIIKGDTAGTFRPTAPITRGEFSAILSRLLSLSLENNKSNITDINGTLFEKEIYSLIKKGIVSGYLDGTFKPNNSITRAEVVKMTNIAINKQTRTGLTNKFYDLTPDFWAYDYILTAATK